jgi:hypothetical protein
MEMERPAQLLISRINESADSIMGLYTAALADIAKFDQTMQTKYVKDMSVRAKRKARKRRENIMDQGPPTAGPSDTKPKEIAPKTDDEKQLIELALLKHYLFSSLGKGSLQDVINLMAQTAIPPATVLIKQGDAGNEFYVLEKVSLACRGFAIMAAILLVCCD